MSSTENVVAFIGLGVMGYPMAVNLRTKMDPNIKLLVCDVSESALSRFQQQMRGQGPVEIVKSGYEAALFADTIITMLPGSGAVKSVYCDPSTGVLAGVAAAVKEFPSQKLLMECGTIERATMMEVAAATANLAETLSAGSSSAFVDAPVSGGPMGAENGTLTFMVGASHPDRIFKSVKNVLRHMGSESSIFLCGDVGAGTAFKVINNYLSAITSLAASEALNIGTKLGLDAKTLTDVINVSGGQCWVTSKSNPVPGVQPNVPASRDYEGGFRIELCRKVLQMGNDLAKSAGARTILAQPTLDAFDECASDSRYAGKDARVVYKWLNDLRNIE